MMKRVFFTAAMLYGLLVAACTDANKEQPTPEPLDPAIVFENTYLTVPQEGGEFAIFYTLENPVEGNVVIANCSDTWIQNMTTMQAGKVVFNVLQNYDNQIRQAKIRVRYTAIAQEYEIVVEQAASTLPKFVYEIEEQNLTSISLRVLPLDKTTPYITRAYTVDHIHAFGLESDPALFDYDLEAIAYEAVANGQSFYNYLRNLSHSGDSETIELKGLYPAMDYVVYTYHIDFSDQSLVGEIYREVIRSGEPDPIEVDLNITYQVEGASVIQTIDPDRSDVFYYTDYMAVQDFERYYGYGVEMADKFVEKWNFNVATLLSRGYSLNSILEQFCKKGASETRYNELHATTEYAFYVFAVDSKTGFAASDIDLQRISTDEAMTSEMTIEIDVRNITSTSADIFWTCSDPEGKFARSVFTETEYNALGDTDQERFLALLSYGMMYFYGSTDINMSSLYPGTTYVAFGYGVDGETPNTRIFTQSFTTL